ncbi:hypothetical protein KR009_011195, partial [Drosophila setifemur]
LGLKSPFIEFGSQEEQLANTSIPLNITKDEQAYMHQEGLRKLGTFIKPVDLRDSETGYVKSDLTKRLTNDPPNSPIRRIHPIQEEMDQKQIILLDEDTDENGLPSSLTDEDRKFIVPMALKNLSPDPRWFGPTTPSYRSPNVKSTLADVSDSQHRPVARAQSSTSHLEMDPTSNIDDLKKHILFLHNMTKTNTNFESKFVKFPSLQRDKPNPTVGSSAIISKRPQRPVLQYAAPIAPPTHKGPQGAHVTGQQMFAGYYLNEENMNNLSIFLKPINNSKAGILSNEVKKLSMEPQMHLLNKTQSTMTQSMAQETTVATINLLNLEPHFRTTKRPPCLRNPDSPKCLRQRRREEQQRQRERDEWFRGQSEFLQPQFQPIIQTINNTKRFAVSIEIPDSYKIHSEGDILSRAVRSQPSSQKHLSDLMEVPKDNTSDKFSHSSAHFDQGIVMASADVASDREYLVANEEKYKVSSQNENFNDTSSIPNAYFEPIDLNPNNCYKVNGLTYGQKKQCVKHTSVMPAISRGARAAIQECQFQFKNRRWNCSTTEDETVFGPMTSLAAPEMAFIHALAAATVTSFIARACRDGQLASCGCSRGTRPKQLHDDWTWGGCGDNLEYAYKFATDFIDVREKESNRQTRGVHRKLAREVTKKSGIQSDEVKALEANNMESKKHEQDLKLTTEIILDLKNKTQSELKPIRKNLNNENSQLLNVNISELSRQEKHAGSRIHNDFLELQQRITKEILNSKLKGRALLELQEKINREIVNSKLFNGDNVGHRRKGKRKNQRAVIDDMPALSVNGLKAKFNFEDEGIYRSQQSTIKAKSLMNLHNNEAGRRAVIKKTRITCKCHGVSGSCSLITCWQQLSSIREIGDYLREKYEEATKVKINKRGRLQVKDSQFKVPTAHDLIYLDESPDWCRTSYMLQWPGTHGRVCRKNSSGLESCAILCCGRGYNTKNIIVKERCNCKFHWCCQVKCEVCTKVLEEHTCK